MSDPDLHDILLRAFFPNGIAPYQYGNLAVLMLDIGELYDLYYQISRTERDNGGNIICRDGTTRQDATLRNVAEVKKEVTKEVIQSTSNAAIKPIQSDPNISPKPFISGTYPANFEESPIQPSEVKPKRMGRPPRVPGSLGLKCPKCGSEDVVSGGYGPNKERRIKCKTCGSQPTVDVANRPFFNDRIDERILALEFEDLSPNEISERLKADGASILASDIDARLKELHTTTQETTA
jgi:hypothetical protein